MLKRRVVLASAALVVLALAGPRLSAGPYFGDWGWFWSPAPGCQRGDYSPLHYWAPELYEARAHFRRANIDQYPPGPSPSVPPSYECTPSKCRTLPPTPMTPYSDPDGYYGRPIAPPGPTTKR